MSAHYSIILFDVPYHTRCCELQLHTTINGGVT